jgi:hypothetical protein
VGVKHKPPLCGGKDGHLIKLLPGQSVTVEWVIKMQAILLLMTGSWER